jgi:conjugal transfer pilin signal peptidase TrbI
LQVYHLKPEKGDLCAFNFVGFRFLKYIVGTAGDEIRNLNGVIYVGLTKVGKATKTKLLTPIEDGVVPEGYIFAAGTHPESFDSRYQEFGLVKTSDIRGKVFGVLRHERAPE